MSIDILMPALSPTMEEGTLAKWHVNICRTQPFIFLANVIFKCMLTEGFSKLFYTNL